MGTRIVRYMAESAPRWGLVKDDQVLELLGNPFGQWEVGSAVGPLEGCTLLAPVTPTKILCVGRNYPAHAAEHGSEVPAEPLLFFKPPSALIGPHHPILLPDLSRRVDYEAELALVIGQRCRDVPADEAWQVVFGVTCANDVTDRVLQRQDYQWTRGKGFDTFCPVGPWVATGMSEAEASDRAVIGRVNGQVRQSGRTSEMAFGLCDVIAYASAVMTLEPGDLFLTGTPAGVGPLQPGDEVEVEVEEIGVLRNPVKSMIMEDRR